MDEGAIISQQGIPIDQASDDQKVLDTRWVTLNIFSGPNYSNVLNLPMVLDGALYVNTGYTTIYTHNLGYLPAFDYLINSYTLSDPNAYTSFEVYADTNNIYLAPSIVTTFSAITLSINITLRIYTLPITQSFQAPTVNTISSVNPTQSNYGVEFALPADVAPDISNLPIAEYSFSTRLKPLNILQTGTYTIPGVGGSIIINYNYPQYPLYMLAQYFPNGINYANLTIANPLVGSLGFQGGRGTISPTTITINGVQAYFFGSFAYILFKDPIGLKQ